MGNKSSRILSITGDESCVICQQNINNRISRPECCPNHFFHHDCLMEWTKYKNTCPLDNREFSTIIDKKGNQYPVEMPRNDENRLSDLAALHRMRRFIESMQRDRFRCDICHEEHSHLERAGTDVCHHRFHRKCLANLARISQVCPVTGCNSEFSEIRCEFGEVMTVDDLDEAYKCAICDERINNEETATPNECKHRFHRRCLVPEAKITKKCPMSSCNSDIHFIKCEKGERIVIQNCITPFECTFCNEIDPEKETVCVSPCGHPFHRECMFRRHRALRDCPFEGCHGNISEVHCQFGDKFRPEYDFVYNVVFYNQRYEAFRCPVCQDRDTEWVRLFLDCGCEFHRRCFAQNVRGRAERRTRPCTRLNCFASTVDESVDDLTSSIDKKKAETNTNNATALDDRMYSEGAERGQISVADNFDSSAAETPTTTNDPESNANKTPTEANDPETNVEKTPTTTNDPETNVEKTPTTTNNPEPNGKTAAFAASVRDDRTYSESEGAVGGFELHTCNLCESLITQGDATRPKNCFHWYHKVCMMNLANEIGCCVSCQGDLSDKVEESAATSSSHRLS